MMVLVVLLIPLSGLLVVLLEGDGLRCGIGLSYLGRLIFGLGRDIEVWPDSVGMLVKWVAFVSSLHWRLVWVVFPMWICTFCANFG